MRVDCRSYASWCETNAKSVKRVTVDGEDIGGCFLADEEAGEAHQYLVTNEGKDIPVRKFTPLDPDAYVINGVWARAIRGKVVIQMVSDGCQDSNRRQSSVSGVPAH